MQERVALLGLGLMGSGMARNLLKAGLPLTVYNRTRERTASLRAAGARVADTPREAAADADIVISMVTDDSASRAIWLGDEGVLAGARKGALLVESSTLSPVWVRELAGMAAAKGCAWLDAPVSGSKPQADAAELIFFVGGDAAALERARPVLNTMGKVIYHLGPRGSGATMKLVNNLVSGVEMAVFGEAMLLAEQAGLDRRLVAQILSNGLPGSPIIKARAPMVLERGYSTQFALRLMHKDLTYALDEAVHQNVPLPTVATAREIYRMAIERGLGDLDFAAVGEALRADGKGAKP